jgi:hypothetical protein
MQADSTRNDWPVLGLALVAVLSLVALAGVLVRRTDRVRRT